MIQKVDFPISKTFKAAQSIKCRAFKRSFLCWRSRDFDDRYECSVSGTDRQGVRIEFESEGLEVGAEIAAEIAFCLSEALAIAAQKDVHGVTAALRDDGPLSRKYRLSWGVWQFSASGVLPTKNVSPEFFENTGGADFSICVQTIEEDGFEIVFGEIGYSFSMQDACWLQEKLLEATHQLPKQYPRVNLLEAARDA